MNGAGPVPSTQSPFLLSSLHRLCQVLRTLAGLFPAPGTRYPVPSSFFFHSFTDSARSYGPWQVSSQHPAPSTRYPAPSTRYPVPSHPFFFHPFTDSARSYDPGRSLPSTQHPVPSTLFFLLSSLHRLCQVLRTLAGLFPAFFHSSTLRPFDSSTSSLFHLPIFLSFHYSILHSLKALKKLLTIFRFKVTPQASFCFHNCLFF
ncbi:hypothetical protein ES705_23654 [subsurface metagenome]